MEQLFEQLADDPDFEYVIVDGTIVPVHKHGCGAKRGTQNQAIGRSRGGLTTKIVPLVDALGNLVGLTLLPGQRHDCIGVALLHEGLDFDALLADKAFDNNRLSADLVKRDAEAVIPSKSYRKKPIPHDPHTYTWRHLVENFFRRIKEFRRIAMRTDKTDTSYSAMLHLAVTYLAVQ